MQDRWWEQDAKEVVEGYAGTHGRDLALRTYSSRLLGADPALVLHGGGNTSLKATWSDRFGEAREALFVKASGHDLAGIEPEGHVAVELEPLRRLLQLDELSDPEMTDELRRLLEINFGPWDRLDGNAPFMDGVGAKPAGAAHTATRTLSCGPTVITS